MTTPVSDAVLAEIRELARGIAALPPSERRVRLRDLHRAPVQLASADAPDIDGKQGASLIVDQVRLDEIEKVRADAGSLRGPLQVLRQRAGGRVAVLSGAGLSVDAGFPTFRGEEGEGLWENVDPMTVASVDGYRADPMRCIRWYCWRRSLGIRAVPTLAHAAMAQAQAQRPEAWAGVHTQNVDGLHEAAGNSGVNRIHGSIWCWRKVSTFELVFDPTHHVEDVELDAGGMPAVRPGVVMFGDFAPTSVYERAMRELRRADVALVVGTAAQVSTLWPLLHTASGAGALMVDINPEPSPVATEMGGLSIPLPSGAGVPLALEALGAIAPEDTDRLARTPRPPLSAVIDGIGPDLLADDDGSSTVASHN